MTSLGMYLKLLPLISQTKWLFKVKHFVILHWHVSIIDSFVGPNAPRGSYMYLSSQSPFDTFSSKVAKVKTWQSFQISFQKDSKKYKFDKREVSFEWSHNRLSSTDSKVSMQTNVDYKWQEVLALVWILWFQLDLP